MSDRKESDSVTILGTLLVEEFGLDREMLESALTIQAQGDGGGLGEILVHLGAITFDQLRRALDLQQRLRASPVPSTEPRRDVPVSTSARDVPSGYKPDEATLGAILIETCGVSADAIQAALVHQSLLPGQRIGEILIGMRVVSQAQLDQAIQRQHAMHQHAEKLDERSLATAVRAIENAICDLLAEGVPPESALNEAWRICSAQIPRLSSHTELRDCLLNYARDEQENAPTLTE